jgi:hypothetical protein
MANVAKHARAGRAEVAVLDRHWHPRSQRVHSRAQPTLGEDRWEEAVRELAQLGHRLLGLVEHLGQQGGGILLLVLEGAVCELERDDRVDQPLLRAVVQVSASPATSA